jgi:hypothetical protein
VVAADGPEVLARRLAPLGACQPRLAAAVLNVSITEISPMSKPLEPDESANPVAGDPPKIDVAPPRPRDLARLVSCAMVLGAAATIALILYGVIRFPTVLNVRRDALSAIGAGVGIATAYGFIGWFGVRAPGLRDPRLLREGVRFGLCSGGLFAFSMLGEYLVPHDEHQNMILGLTTFGLFFALLFASGLCATLATGRASSGPLASLWSALIASQLWFLLLLGTYYAFLETKAEARFLVVDQVIADFQRSGAPDLRAFIFEDYMGGGFFHSLLAPLFALVLGSLAAGCAKLLLFVKGTLRGGA